ncbi:MAG: FxLYD domain-containing protein [Leptolyngbyaceae cyanobacterium]
MGRDRIIETYIQRLRAQAAPVTADRINALAQEIGLEPEDMAAIKQSAQNHRERGRSYLEFDCFDDAIEELTQAIALDPLDLESLQPLTYAYDQRYGKEKKKTDKTQAIALARRWEELNPNAAEPIILISARDDEANKSQWVIWLGLALVAFAIGLRPVTNFIATRAEINELTKDIADLDPEPLQPVPEPSAADAAIPIPITLDQTGLTLDSRLSQLDNYEDVSYYTLQGVILNESQQAIETLQLTVEYLDTDGTIIETDSKNVIETSDATVRPGDSHPIDLIYKTTPDLASVRLSAAAVDQVPTPASAPQPESIPYTWNIQQPAQLTFDLAARSEALDSYDVTDSAYFTATWAITNTSDTTIHQLKLQINFYDSQNQPILGQELPIIYGGDAPLLPNETRPISLATLIDKTYSRYEVTVLEAE